MSNNKEKVTEAIGIVSAVIGLIRLIVGLFDTEKGRKKEHCSHEKKHEVEQ
jgi:methionine salvage enolase-phosphatase E1